VLLCEGQHDSQFFTYLLQAHPSLPAFEISSVDYVLGSRQGGNTRFTEALDELPSIAGFDQVDRILIVADNDINPAVEFAHIVAQINATAPIIGPPAGRFVAPPTEQVRSSGTPSIVVLMLPWTSIPGNLDTMCLRATLNQAGISFENCVDAFAKCTGADKWPLTALAKMKLRSSLSSLWQGNPYISPAYVWSRNTNLVPLTDPIFNQVVNFVKNFPSL
jgi:hypothetical protein